MADRYVVAMIGIYNHRIYYRKYNSDIWKFCKDGSLNQAKFYESKEAAECDNIHDLETDGILYNKLAISESDFKRAYIEKQLSCDSF